MESLGIWQLLVGIGKTAIVADITGAEIALAVAPDGGENDIENAHNDAQNATSEDKAPPRETDLGGIVGWKVELAEQVATDDHHSEAEPCQAMMVAQNGPCVVEVTPGQRQLRDTEKE